MQADGAAVGLGGSADAYTLADAASPAHIGLHHIQRADIQHRGEIAGPLLGLTAHDL